VETQAQHAAALLSARTSCYHGAPAVTEVLLLLLQAVPPPTIANCCAHQWERSQRMDQYLQQQHPGEAAEQAFSAVQREGQSYATCVPVPVRCGSPTVSSAAAAACVTAAAQSPTPPRPRARLARQLQWRSWALRLTPGCTAPLMRQSWWWQACPPRQPGRQHDAGI
jgi:hypothetical protein